jgi:hypothetical protein
VPNVRRAGHVQCVANKATALASKSHEIINPANMRQPRAFDIAPRSARSILLGSTSCPVGRSTDAFDVRDGPSGPVPMVEEALTFRLSDLCLPCFVLRPWGSSFLHGLRPVQSDNRR